jgi:NAD(P)-dependent dehydrogenase (short-subunit alcohol dehydrogenase family)
VGALDGKTAVITGGNSGIGFETAVALLQQGVHVVITSRDAQRGAAASEAIKARTGRAPEVMALDLASFAAIRRFADDFSATYDRLDILVLNAGAIIKQRRVSEDGTSCSSSRTISATSYSPTYCATASSRVRRRALWWCPRMRTARCAVSTSTTSRRPTTATARSAPTAARSS